MSRPVRLTRRRAVEQGRRPAAPTRARSPLWQDSDFVKLWAGETLSQTGSQITVVALPLIAILTLHAGAGLVGLLTTAQFLPILLISLVAGSWVDTKRIKPIIVLCHFSRAVLIALIPIAYLIGQLSVPLLLGDAFVIGCF